jgi:hypothetical protein
MKSKAAIFNWCCKVSYKHELTRLCFLSFSFTALYRDVEAADKQCNELEKVVALVENHRQRFRHIDNVSE